MTDLLDDIAQLNRERALGLNRDLFDRFGGRDRLGGTMDDQAAAIEMILGACAPKADGSAAVTVHIFADATLLADLAVAAFRLRKMAPHEADIRKLVVGK